MCIRDRIETDEGISGIGEGTLEYKEHALLGAIEDLKRVLIGQEMCIRDRYGALGKVFVIFCGFALIAAALFALQESTGRLVLLFFGLSLIHI